MPNDPRRALPIARSCAALVAAACAISFALAAPASGAADPYSNPSFTSRVTAGLTAFYSRKFAEAKAEFSAALQIAPSDSLAISLENAAARNIGPEALAVLSNDEEDAVSKRPKDALAQTRLAYTYLFQQSYIPSRGQDARDALNAAVSADANLAAAHVGMGIYRLNEESTNRAKVEFLTALKQAPHDVLAREYLASIYQTDLRDPNRALSYLINIPNLVPNYADAYYHLASIMDDLGQYDAAVKYLKTAIELDKGHVGEAGQFGLPLLGQIYLKTHRIDDAKQAFSQAIVFGEEPEYSKKQLEKIRRGDYK